MNLLATSIVFRLIHYKFQWYNSINYRTANHRILFKPLHLNGMGVSVIIYFNLDNNYPV